MTNYTKLIQRLRTDAMFDSTTLGNEVADAIEAQAAEIERLKTSFTTAIKVAKESADLNDRLAAERDALQAKMQALEKQKQEPVAWIEWDLNLDEGDPDSISVGCNKPDVACDGWEWRPIYAATKALEPLTDEQIDYIYNEHRGDGGSDAMCDGFARAIEHAHRIGGKP